MPTTKLVPLAPPPPRPRALPDASERQLFELVYHRMRALAGASAPDLDDLVQLAAEQVFRNLPTFAGRSELGTWVYGVCYRVLLNQRRWYRRWSARFSSVAEPETASSEPLPVEALESHERAQRLRRVFVEMSDKYRAVVVLHDMEGLSVQEIAEIVVANPLTVRSRLRDGRRQLRQLLEREFGPGCEVFA